MSTPRLTHRALVALASLALFAPAALALNPALPPSGNFDLTHWKLTLPVDSSGGTSGNAVDIQESTLAAGFVATTSTGYNNNYFYTNSSDGSMVFWCPVTGATTSGSSFPRCELREVLNPSDDNVNWDPGVGTHTLDAQCKVTAIPSTNKTIIGQIHGFSGNAYPLIKLQFNNGTVEALVKLDPSSDTDTHYTFANIGLNNLITYEISTSGGTITMTVNGSTQTADIHLWTGQQCYFKAGNYCQDNSGSGEAANVEFYALTASHSGGSPTITTTTLPGGRTTISYGSQQLVATGGTTPYTWSLSSGTLPAGLSLGSSTGIISGTPTTAGTSSFTAQVTDAGSQSDTQALSITINTNSVPSITTTSLPAGTTGTAYSQSVTSTGGDGVLLWSVSSGSLPAGLSLGNVNNQNATLSGTPATPGTSNFTLHLSDVDSDTASQALSIVVNAPAQVGAPAFSPGGGTYTSAQSVTISTTTSGASIRYTINGSTPTSTSGTVYSTAVAISATTTLKAIAYKAGMTDSTVTSGTYTINTGGSISASAGGSWQNSTMVAESGTFTAAFDAMPSASPNNALVALSLGAQTTFTGFACIVRFNTSGDIDARNAGAYAADTTVPFAANSTYHFRLVVNLSAHTYSIFVTPPGGTETSLGSNYAFRTEQNTVATLDHWGVFVDTTANSGAGTLTVSNFTVQVAAPVFSPGAGTYSSTQSVSISSSTSGASIRYTTDGSTPTSTSGTIYTGPVTVSATTTLNAIAYETGLTDSSVASATYTISGGGANTVPVILEAESVSFDSNWQNLTDANAYGGHALQALTNSTGSAPSNGGLVYSFTLGSSSTIYIQTRSRSPNGGSSDSFWVRLDSGSWAQFVQGGTNTYTWSNKSFSSVASGAHTFEIRYREANAVLDEVAVTLTSSAPN